jgi:hypothetical protein
LGLWPNAVPFPSAEGGASPELDEIVHGPAAALTAVALVVGAEARASGWAAGAAVALARRWGGPRRIVLVDLGLDAPSLHAAAGVPNDEGVADVVDYGISLGVVRQSSADGAFDIVTTGAWIADPPAVLRAAAWSRVLVEVAQQRGTLLAYVPADADGMDAVVRRAGAVIVLATEAEGGAIVEALPHPYAVLTILTPPAAAPEGEAEPAADPLTGSSAEEADEPLVLAAGVEELFGSPEQPEIVAEPTIGAVEPPAAAAEPSVSAAEPVRLSDEEFDRIRLPTDRASREALIADLRERQRAARMSPPADAERPAQPRDEEATPLVAGEVRVPAGHSEHALDARVETMGDDVGLETMAPAPPLEDAQVRSRYRFHIAPLEREGTLYYHVMAGPVRDSAAAVALRDTLLARRLKTAATPTTCGTRRWRSWSATTAARTARAEQMTELRRLDVPGTCCSRTRRTASRCTASTSAASQRPRGGGRRGSCCGRQASGIHSSHERAASLHEASSSHAAGIQVLRRPHRAPVPRRHHGHRRAERLRQVEHQRRHPLGAGRAARVGDPRLEDGGGDLPGHDAAAAAGARGGRARVRQRRSSAWRCRTATSRSGASCSARAAATTS